MLESRSAAAGPRSAKSNPLATNNGSPFWPLSAAAVALLSVALVSMGAGIFCLYARFAQARSGPLLAPAALVLIACGTAQVWRLVATWQSARNRSRERPRWVARGHWGRLLLGVAGTYVAALAIGPREGLGWAWMASVSLIHTLLMMPLAAPPRVLDDWRKWVAQHTPRRTTWLVPAAILLLIGAEMALQAERAAREAAWITTPPAAESTAPKTLPAAQPAEAALQDPVDLGVAWLNATRFRVAVLGEGPAAHPASGYLALLAQRMPSLEIVPIPSAWPMVDTEAFDQQLAELQPNLVLGLFDACEDVVPAAPARNYFDWRSFELSKRLLGTRPAVTSQLGAAGPIAFEDHLRSVSQQVMVCRTPTSAAMRGRWQQTFAALDRVSQRCAQADIPLALVLVPGEFQVNSSLRATLLRRGGLASDAVDAELPQRRVSNFAAERKLPVVDLLPHLKLCRQAVFARNTTQLSEHGRSAAAAAVGGWLESRFAGQIAAQLSSTGAGGQ